MRLSDMLDEDHVLSDLKARDKKEVLEELSEVITAHDPSLEKSALVKVLLVKR